MPTINYNNSNSYPISPGTEQGDLTVANYPGLFTNYDVFEARIAEAIKDAGIGGGSSSGITQAEIQAAFTAALNGQNQREFNDFIFIDANDNYFIRRTIINESTGVVTTQLLDIDGNVTVTPIVPPIRAIGEGDLTLNKKIIESYYANSSLAGQYNIGDKLLQLVDVLDVSQSIWYNATQRSLLTALPSTALVRDIKDVVITQTLTVVPATANSPSFPFVTTTQGVSAALTVPLIDGKKANYFVARPVGTIFNGAIRGNDGQTNRFLVLTAPGGSVSRYNIFSAATPSVSVGTIPNEMISIDFVSWSTALSTSFNVEFRYVPDSNRITFESLPTSPFLNIFENAVTTGSAASILLPVSTSDGRVYIRTTGASTTCTFAMQTFINPTIGMQTIASLTLPVGVSFGYMDLGNYQGGRLQILLTAGTLTNFDVQYYFNNIGS